VASIELYEQSKTAKEEAYSDLTSYIFGHNEFNEKMALTSPVIQQDMEMSFILPHYYLRKKIPHPINKKISLKETPLRYIAVISYNGANSDEKIAEHTQELQFWLRKHPWFLPVGKIQRAQYDGIFTLPFLRKNELHIEVKNVH
jgi:hypothetical protein